MNVKDDINNVGRQDELPKIYANMHGFQQYDNPKIGSSSESSI